MESDDMQIPADFLDFVGKSNIPMSSPLAVRIALNKLGLQCRYDEFHVIYYISGALLGTNRELVIDDPMMRRIGELIHLRCEFNPLPTHLEAGVKRACEANSFHPIKDYLEGLKWDGVPRLERWLVDYMQAKDIPFIREVGRIVLVASVARIYEPGVKFDYITVLESDEGYDKSKAISLIYGDENFDDQSILGMDPKQVEETLRGIWGLECAEIAGMRKGDMDKIKAQLSRRKDRVRRVWDKMVTSASRTAILWGTTNNQDYLRAQSGENRRFFPVKVGRIDIPGLTRDRDQLWAEAMEQYQYDARGFMLPEVLWPDARAERVSRTQHDPWADLLEQAPEMAARAERQRQAREAKGTEVTEPPVYERTETEERIAGAYLMETVLGIPVERRNTDHARRVAAIMRELGWEHRDAVRIGGKPTRGYVRPVTPAVAMIEWREPRSDGSAEVDDSDFI